MLSVAFWSFLLTQFLGAFNDNYFKQMVLLTCVSQVAKAQGESAPDRQPLALAAFAIPFVLLSGLGGFLSDRCAPSTRVIVGCKIAEVGIMGVGLMVLLIDGLSADAQLLSLIGVLLLMGAHSAIFAPSKYGVLPELFREEQLLPVNGAVQMTTFLAIIFGTAGAGIALDQIQRSMWIGSLIAMGIAMVGTFASLFIPRTPIAQPNLQLKWEDLFLPREIAQLIRRDRGLLLAILIAAIFWFLGGVTQMSVNTLGKATLKLSDTRTSLMVAGIGFGIMAGCIIAGFLGKGQSGRRWVLIGSWLLLISLSLIAFLGSGLAGLRSMLKRKIRRFWSACCRPICWNGVSDSAWCFWGCPLACLSFRFRCFCSRHRLPSIRDGCWACRIWSPGSGFCCRLRLSAWPGWHCEESRVRTGMLATNGPCLRRLALLMVPVCLFYRLPEARRREL
jgi:MFS family permease